MLATVADVGVGTRNVDVALCEEDVDVTLPSPLTVLLEDCDGQFAMLSVKVLA